MVNSNDLDEIGGLHQGPFEPIAVFGMGCLMPDANNLDDFWNNIIKSKVSIRDLPEYRWDLADFYNEDGGVNKTYSKIGAFVENYEFDWRKYAGKADSGQIKR